MTVFFGNTAIKDIRRASDYVATPSFNYGVIDYVYRGGSLVWKRNKTTMFESSEAGTYNVTLSEGEYRFLVISAGSALYTNSKGKTFKISGPSVADFVLTTSGDFSITVGKGGVSSGEMADAQGGESSLTWGDYSVVCPAGTVLGVGSAFSTAPTLTLPDDVTVNYYSRSYRVSWYDPYIKGTTYGHNGTSDHPDGYDGYVLIEKIN